jgi:hypothetical protein
VAQAEEPSGVTARLQRRHHEVEEFVRSSELQADIPGASRAQIAVTERDQAGTMGHHRGHPSLEPRAGPLVVALLGGLAGGMTPGVLPTGSGVPPVSWTPIKGSRE